MVWSGRDIRNLKIYKVIVNSSSNIKLTYDPLATVRINDAILDFGIILEV